MGTKENQADKPTTVMSVFKKTAETAPKHLALGKIYQILAHAVKKGYCYHFVSVVIIQWIHHTLISSPKTTTENVKKVCKNVPLVIRIRICELGIDL